MSLFWALMPGPGPNDSKYIGPALILVVFVALAAWLGKDAAFWIMGGFFALILVFVVVMITKAKPAAQVRAELDAEHARAERIRNIHRPPPSPAPPPPKKAGGLPAFEVEAAMVRARHKQEIKAAEDAYGEAVRGGADSIAEDQKIEKVYRRHRQELDALRKSYGV